MFGLVRESKYNALKASNEALKLAVQNLEKALRNQKIATEVVKAEHEAAVNELFNYSGSLTKMYDEKKEVEVDLNKYKEAAEQIADIVLKLSWNDMSHVYSDCDGDEWITKSETEEQEVIAE